MFITLEGDNFVFGLNFAKFEEAKRFKEALEKRRENEKRLMGMYEFAKFQL